MICGRRSLAPHAFFFFFQFSLQRFAFFDQLLLQCFGFFQISGRHGLGNFALQCDFPPGNLCGIFRIQLGQLVFLRVREFARRARFYSAVPLRVRRRISFLNGFWDFGSGIWADCRRGFGYFYQPSTLNYQLFSSSTAGWEISWAMGAGLAITSSGSFSWDCFGRLGPGGILPPGFNFCLQAMFLGSHLVAGLHVKQ